MSDLNPSPEADLEKRITEALERLHDLKPEDKEYAQAADQVVKLYGLRTKNKELELETVAKTREFEASLRPKPLSRDTLVLAGANLLGIVLIVGHERANVVTSKALSFIKTLR